MTLSLESHQFRLRMRVGHGPPEVTAGVALNPPGPANRRLGSKGVPRAARRTCLAQQRVKPESRQAQEGDFPDPFLLSVLFLVVNT